MANHKATKKDVRQATKRRDRNRYYGKTTRNAIRDLKDIKEQKEAGDKLPEIQSPGGKNQNPNHSPPDGPVNQSQPRQVASCQ